MHMIHIRFQCQQRQAMPLTTPDNQPLGCGLHLSGEYLVPIFGYPDQMIRDGIVGISGFTHL